jgi:hypothetical protein
MSEVVIVAVCLLGYIAASSEVLVYAVGADAVPRLFRLGIAPFPTHTGRGKAARAVAGAAFTLVLLAAIGLLTLGSTPARSVDVVVLLRLEFAAALAWTLFLLIRFVQWRGHKAA